MYIDTFSSLKEHKLPMTKSELQGSIPNQVRYLWGFGKTERTATSPHGKNYYYSALLSLLQYLRFNNSKLLGHKSSQPTAKIPYKICSLNVIRYLNRRETRHTFRGSRKKQNCLEDSGIPEHSLLWLWSRTCERKPMCTRLYPTLWTLYYLRI